MRVQMSFQDAGEAQLPLHRRHAGRPSMGVIGRRVFPHYGVSKLANVRLASSTISCHSGIA